MDLGLGALTAKGMGFNPWWGKLRFHELHRVAKKRDKKQKQKIMCKASALSAARVISVSSPTRCIRRPLSQATSSDSGKPIEVQAKALDEETGRTQTSVRLHSPGPGLTGSPTLRDRCCNTAEEASHGPQAEVAEPAWTPRSLRHLPCHRHLGEPQEAQKALGWLHPNCHNLSQIPASQACF